jgi:hypothetical protein
MLGPTGTQACSLHFVLPSRRTFTNEAPSSRVHGRQNAGALEGAEAVAEAPEKAAGDNGDRRLQQLWCHSMEQVRQHPERRAAGATPLGALPLFAAASSSNTTDRAKSMVHGADGSPS